MSNSWFKVRELADSVFMIQEPLRRLAPDYLTNTVNMFVIHDNKEALVIDCGTGIYSLSELILSALDKRTIVTPFVTHSHWDHVGSLYEFDGALIHGQELKNIRREENLELIREDIFERNDPVSQDIQYPFVRRSFSGEIVDVKDGEWLQIGRALELQVIYLPGHTPGSIGLWYPDEKFLFVGDTFQTGYNYADQDPKLFFKSLEKMREIVGCYYMPAHEEILLHDTDIVELIKMFTKIENGTADMVNLKNRYLDNKLVSGERFSVILPRE